jgi:hypothetical protein
LLLVIEIFRILLLLFCQPAHPVLRNSEQHSVSGEARALLGILEPVIVLAFDDLGAFKSTFSKPVSGRSFHRGYIVAGFHVAGCRLG